MKLRHFSVALAVGVFALAGEAWARSQVQVVGASETYPLTKAVADAFSAGGAFPEPDIRSTGSGGGIKQFCGGVGAATPDVVSTIRPMRDQEKAQCEANGVDVGALTEGDQPIGLINEKPVFVYFKPAHVGVVKGLREFLAAFRSAAGDA
ncbi:MAG: substrate-binding domain-containing protein [Pseudomonadota bacterium]